MPLRPSFSAGRTYIFWLRSNCYRTSNDIYNSVYLSWTKKKVWFHKQKTNKTKWGSTNFRKQHSLLLTTEKKMMRRVVIVANFTKPLRTFSTDADVKSKDTWNWLQTVDRSPWPGESNSHTRSTLRRFYRPVYFWTHFRARFPAKIESPPCVWAHSKYKISKRKNKRY